MTFFFYMYLSCSSLISLSLVVTLSSPSSWFLSSSSVLLNLCLVFSPFISPLLLSLSLVQCASPFLSNLIHSALTLVSAFLFHSPSFCLSVLLAVVGRRAGVGGSWRPKLARRGTKYRSMLSLLSSLSYDCRCPASRFSCVIAADVSFDKFKFLLLPHGHAAGIYIRIAIKSLWLLHHIKHQTNYSKSMNLRNFERHKSNVYTVCI